MKQTFFFFFLIRRRQPRAGTGRVFEIPVTENRISNDHIKQVSLFLAFFFSFTHSCRQSSDIKQFHEYNAILQQWRIVNFVRHISFNINLVTLVTLTSCVTKHGNLYETRNLKQLQVLALNERSFSRDDWLIFFFFLFADSNTRLTEMDTWQRHSVSVSLSRVLLITQ